MQQPQWNALQNSGQVEPKVPPPMPPLPPGEPDYVSGK